MSDPTLTVNDDTVAFVCDRILTAAIGTNWRQRVSEAVIDFWIDEVREALVDAAKEGSCE